MARVRLAALVMGYLLLAFIGLHRYFYLSPELLLGMIAVFVSWKGTRPKKNSAILFSVTAFIFALLYAHLASKSLLMLSVGFALLSLLPIQFGRAGWSAIISMLLATPLFEYFSNVFSFPIRLALTKLAGHLLTVMGTGFHAEGNMLRSGSIEFSVDPACMGLHMLSLSLLTGMILTGLLRRRAGVRLTVPVTIGLLIMLFGLNLLSNVLRIVMLVQFRIVPEAPMHSVTGIVCFLVYVLCPAFWLIRFAVNRFGKKQEPPASPADGIIPNRLLALHLTLIVLISLALWRTDGKAANANLQLGGADTPGCKTEILQDRIVKLTNEETLIYLKPIAGFYSADHQPGICWTGSGYLFRQIEEKEIAGRRMYTARLEKDKDILYSAWWYDSGFSSTTSQFDWRWDAFRHSRHYALVNITSNSPGQLEKEILQFIKKNPCRRMLMN